MKAFSLTVGEWLLMLMNVPDALIGDLQEAAQVRSLIWYWREGILAALATLDGYARSHPMRASWAGTMVLIGVFGFFHVTERVVLAVAHRPAKPACADSCADPIWLTNDTFVGITIESPR